MMVTNYIKKVKKWSKVIKKWSKQATTVKMDKTVKNDKWIIDSGCSHHMTGDKSKFITLTCYDGNS
jgi:hypothetical protein